MTSRRAFLTLGASSLFWPGVSAAQPAQKRYALVIGNNNYPPGIGLLRNAVNDAKLVSNVLGQCGFEIPPGALIMDGNQQRIQLQARAHAERLIAAGPNAIGFVYYSGHGAARANGDNYLIPILGADVDVHTASVWDESVAVEWLLNDAFAGIEAPQIVSIDACRNELRTNERGIGGSGTFVVRGMEVVANQEDANLFLSFATWQGQTASDGAVADGNGPYALALASSLVEPGPILTLFDRVRRDVKKRTSRKQEVMNVSRLSDDASDLTIGGGIDPSLLPVAAASPVGVNGADRSIDGTANIALVMSCSYLGSAHPLPNARQDASAVADALRASDFSVSIFHDITIEAMRGAILAFAAELSAKRAVGVIHFSGHTAGIVGDNYLIPEGELPRRAVDLRKVDTTIPLSWVVDNLTDQITGPKPDGVVIFLDGCRDLDIPGVVGKTLARNVVRQRPNDNVVIAFPVEPSNFAGSVVPGGRDGAPAGSLFAQALAEEIRAPERRHITEMMFNVTERVRLQTLNRMSPSFVATGLPIYFRDGTGLSL